MTIYFTVPGNPQPKQRARVVNGHSYTPRKTISAETTVALYCLRALRSPRFSGALRVELRFYRSDNRRVDTDNLAKLVLDALNGVAWLDDSQIVRLSVEKHVDRENPRTEVEVSTL